MMIVPPGGTIGILGGGQLGRMLATAAAELGFDVHVFTPESDSPAARVAARTTVASYDDAAALAAFAAAVDVVTFEFESVPHRAAEILREAGAVLRPQASAFAVARNRLAEKRFFNAVGIETAAFAPIGAETLDLALAAVGLPAIIKTAEDGYDGKGQARVASREEAEAAIARLGPGPLIIEAFCQFEREISIVAARGEDGAFVAFEPGENRHEAGILSTTIVPARISPEIAAKARAHVSALMEALAYVGVLAVEFFVMPDGRLLGNEMAPRVHNSGHWTQDAASVSQFELQIRAAAGWPLPAPERFADVEMRNLLGEDAALWRSFAADPKARLHLYGKREARTGRKMGHVTLLKATKDREVR
jgi:5-(carboxyamino)imidazole ribonucleotide synthase